MTAGSNRKVRWRCEKGHEWVTTPNKRSSGRGCPVCAGSQVLAGFNDLVTMHPALPPLLVVGNPDEVSAGSNKKLRWRCEKGHEWDASTKDRSKGRGCPICAGKEVLQGFNDLMTTTNPLLAARTCGMGPQNDLSRERQESPVAVCGRTRVARCRGQSFPFADVPFALARRSSTDFNDLATIRPDLAKQADGWDPTDSHSRVADGSFMAMHFGPRQVSHCWKIG